MTLLLGEVLLRHYMPELDYFYILRPYQRKIQHLASEFMPGIGPIAQFITNSRGVRARETSHDDTYRILALGCSVTISQYVDQSKMWPAVIEQRLSNRLGKKVWVGNVGGSEVTTRHLLTYFTYYLPQFKDELHATILLIGINDMALMLSKRERYDPRFWEKCGAKYQIQHSFDWVPRIYDQQAPCYRKLHLWKLSSCIKSRLKTSEWYSVGSDYLQLRQRRGEASAYIDQLPDMTSGLEEYRRNLDQIIDRAKELDLRLVFMTQPCLWKTQMETEESSLLWFGWIAGQTEFYSSRVLAEAMECYNQVLLMICQEKGIDCLDLAKLLDKDSSVFYDDVHLNEAGSERVAEILSIYLDNSIFGSRMSHQGKN